MKKAVWLTLVISLVIINGGAEAVHYFGGPYIALFYRLTLALGITLGAAVLAGAGLLVSRLEAEQPKSARVADTLGDSHAPPPERRPREQPAAAQDADPHKETMT